MDDSRFNSPTERILVLGYRWLASKIDLQSGIGGLLYRNVYFFYKRVTDRKTISAIRHLLRPDTIVVDVGANIGSFARMICRYSGASVLAFEPEEVNFRQLLAAVKSPPFLDRVSCYRFALSNQTGPATLYLSELAPTDHKLIDSRSMSAVQIETVTLDEFLADHPDLADVPISLVKIDVQGAEILVLEGMRKSMKKNGFPPIVTEFSPSDLQCANIAPSAYFRAFLDLGYRPHSLADGKLRDADWFVRNTDAYTNILILRHGSGEGQGST